MRRLGYFAVFANRIIVHVLYTPRQLQAITQATKPMPFYTMFITTHQNAVKLKRSQYHRTLNTTHKHSIVTLNEMPVLKK